MNYHGIDENILVYISRYFNKNFVSLAPIRAFQNSKFVSKIKRQALEKLQDSNKLVDHRLFYVGSVDFMVTKTNGKRQFAILETNGGSSRGILSLAPGQTEMIFRAYKQAIDDSTDWEDRKIVLIGTVANDRLFHEKIMLIEFLKYQYEMEGLKVAIFNSYTFDPSSIPSDIDIILIFANYPNLLEYLSYRNQKIIFKGKDINVVIGDGVARRFPIVSAHMKHGWESIKTRIVNPIYQISDDKANTYLAIRKGYKRLKPFRVKNLSFGKADDPFLLEDCLRRIVRKSEKNFIIKPFGSSGGVGIQPVSHTIKEDDVDVIIEKSIVEFYKNYNALRSPFPYTVQQMADFELIEWKNSKRAFDIRIYVAQKDGYLFPIGGEGRVAKIPYTGGLNKEEFVVNITGYGGVDIERVIGFSPEGLKILNLHENDLMDIFCAACETIHCMTDFYTEIVNYDKWETIDPLNE